MKVRQEGEEEIMATVNAQAYGVLLAEEKPTVIHDDEAHALAIERLTKLSMKGEAITPEELEYINLLATLVEDYERKRWKRRRQKFSGREMLVFLMKENDLKQTDLTDIAPQSNISAILAGRRTIGLSTAVKLGKRFHVDPTLFVDLNSASA